jgi:hypothetical protein
MVDMLLRLGDADETSGWGPGQMVLKAVTGTPRILGSNDLLYASECSTYPTPNGKSWTWSTISPARIDPATIVSN